MATPMPISVEADSLSIVTQKSGCVAMASVPDVCNNGTSVVPLVNVALSSTLSGGPTDIQVDGVMPAVMSPSCKFSMSNGDEAGVSGVTSGTIMLEAWFISGSPTVRLGGLPVCRSGDQTMNN